jgi:hypothetical protein
MLAAATPALAAEGLYLTWGDCALGLNAPHDRVSACAANTGGQTLYCAFQMPYPADSVLGVDIVVDVQSSATSMPPWWDFAPDSCRDGKMTVNLDFSLNTACAEFWFTQATGGLQGYYLGQPRGSASQARIKIAAAVLPGNGYRQLNATDMYYAAEIVISDALTTGTGSCVGCFQPTCLVFNSIAIRRQPGAPGGDILIETPGPGQANWATWQGAGGVDCQAVPVRPSTWGQIKNLYR